MKKGKHAKLLVAFIPIVLISTVITQMSNIYNMFEQHIKLKPEYLIYPVGVTSISATWIYVFRNNYYCTSSRFTLEKLINEEWVIIKEQEIEPLFNSDSVTIYHGSKEIFDFTKYSSGLAEGKYRVVKQLEKNNDGSIIDVYCYFVCTANR